MDYWCFLTTETSRHTSRNVPIVVLILIVVAIAVFVGVLYGRSSGSSQQTSASTHAASAAGTWFNITSVYVQWNGRQYLELPKTNFNLSAGFPITIALSYVNNGQGFSPNKINDVSSGSLPNTGFGTAICSSPQSSFQQGVFDGETYDSPLQVAPSGCFNYTSANYAAGSYVYFWFTINPPSDEAYSGPTVLYVS